MKKRPRRDDHGFTLLELLVVIAILGLLIGLVAPAVLRQLGNARTSIAKQSIERIASVLDMYKLDVGGYPEDLLEPLLLIERLGEAEPGPGDAGQGPPGGEDVRQVGKRGLRGVPGVLWARHDRGLPGGFYPGEPRRKVDTIV